MTIISNLSSTQTGLIPKGESPNIISLLPRDTTIKIMGFLNKFDIQNIRLVNKHLKKIGIAAYHFNSFASIRESLHVSIQRAECFIETHPPLAHTVEQLKTLKSRCEIQLLPTMREISVHMAAINTAISKECSKLPNWLFDKVFLPRYSDFIFREPLNWMEEIQVERKVHRMMAQPGEFRPWELDLMLNSLVHRKHFNLALDLAISNPYDLKRIHSVLHVISSLLAIYPTERGLDRVLAFFHALEDQDCKGAILCPIVKKLPDIEKKIEITLSANVDGFYTREPLAHIVNKLTDAQDFDRAIEFAKRIENDQNGSHRTKHFAICQLAVGLAKSGQLDRAIAITESLPDNEESKEDIRFELEKYKK